MKGWTEQAIKDLAKAGKIRGYQVIERPKEGRIVSKHFKKRSKEKNWMAENLLYICNKHCVQLIEEYRFHPERKWRFDYAAPALKIAWEWEGIMSDHSRHTNVKGFSRDATKYNECQALGWIVLRFTVLNKDEFTEITERAIAQRMANIVSK